MRSTTLHALKHTAGGGIEFIIQLTNQATNRATIATDACNMLNIERLAVSSYVFMHKILIVIKCR